MGLEECRHFFEEAEQPFVVWIDYKNLKYLKTAKRLNPRVKHDGACFSKFNFILLYRPGAKNAKPDALSRQFTATKDDDQTPHYILPTTVRQGHCTWKLNRRSPITHHWMTVHPTSCSLPFHFFRKCCISAMPPILFATLEQCASDF